MTRAWIESGSLPGPCDSFGYASAEVVRVPIGARCAIHNGAGCRAYGFERNVFRELGEVPETFLERQLFSDCLVAEDRQQRVPIWVAGVQLSQFVLDMNVRRIPQPPTAGAQRLSAQRDDRRVGVLSTVKGLTQPHDCSYAASFRKVGLTGWLRRRRAGRRTAVPEPQVARLQLGPARTDEPRRPVLTLSARRASRLRRSGWALQAAQRARAGALW